MPANVESMAYNAGRGMPWHREGTGFAPGSIQTWDQMRQAAGLEWEVEEEPVYRRTPDGEFEPVENHKNIYRNDRYTRPGVENGGTLQVAKNSYSIINHQAMGDILEALYSVGNSAKGIGLDWDTAGSLNGGRRIFVTAALGDDYHVPGDPSPIRRFLCVLNSHDGTSACRGGQLDTRIVCANTFHAGEMEMRRTKQAFSFRHHGAFKERLEDAKQAIFQATAASENIRKRATQLAALPFTDDQYYEFVDRFLPMPEADTDEGAKLTASKRAAIERARESFQFVASAANPNLTGIRNSVWGVVNAAGEWLDHYKTFRTEDAYVARTLVDINPGKRLAQSIAMDLMNTGAGRKLKVAVPA